MLRVVFVAVSILVFTNSIAQSWIAITNPKGISATMTNQGRTIQIAQEGAYVNLTVVSDTNDDRRMTRLISKPVDEYLLGMIAEMRHGDTDEYSYVVIIARAPRCAHQLLRDSQIREIRGKGPRYSKITLDNPESDTVEILLESDPKSDKELIKPFRYSNGCTRAWLFF